MNCATRVLFLPRVPYYSETLALDLSHIEQKFLCLSDSLSHHYTLADTNFCLSILVKLNLPLIYNFIL